MNLYRATELATGWVDTLRDSCERIEIAGSIRRKKLQPGDIELVAVPKIVRLTDMFGKPDGEVSMLDRAIEKANPVMKKNGPRYKCFTEPIDGEQIDLFIVLPPAQWGVIFAIRTGPRFFSHRLVTIKQHNGYLPSNFVIKDGAVWDGDRMFETPTEEDFFHLLGMPWIPPQDRC